MEKIKVLGLALVMGVVARCGYCSEEGSLTMLSNESYPRMAAKGTLHITESLRMNGGSLTIANHGIYPNSESERTLRIRGSLQTNGGQIIVGGIVSVGDDSAVRSEIAEPGLYRVMFEDPSELQDAITRSSNQISEDSSNTHYTMVTIHPGGKLILPTSSYLVERVSELGE